MTEKDQSSMMDPVTDQVNEVDSEEENNLLKPPQPTNVQQTETSSILDELNMSLVGYNLNKITGNPTSDALFLSQLTHKDRCLFLTLLRFSIESHRDDASSESIRLMEKYFNTINSLHNLDSKDSANPNSRPKKLFDSIIEIAKETYTFEAELSRSPIITFTNESHRLLAIGVKETYSIVFRGEIFNRNQIHILNFVSLHRVQFEQLAAVINNRKLKVKEYSFKIDPEYENQFSEGDIAFFKFAVPVRRTADWLVLAFLQPIDLQNS